MADDADLLADYARLDASIEWSRQQMKKGCRTRAKLLKKIAGPYYPVDDAYKGSRPLNFLFLGANITLRNLVPHQPQAIVSTDFPQFMPTAADFEQILNRRLGPNEINLQAALSICALESLLLMGVMCTGLAIESDNDKGKVFSQPVLFPDLILDMNARSWDEQFYVGHEFDVPVDWIDNTPMLDKNERDQLRKRCNEEAGRTEDDWQRRRVQQYKDTIRLRQIYLPHSNRVQLCCPGMKRPLTNNEWTGPKKGPYRKLSFNNTSGHIYPMAPLPYWNDLDEIINKSFIKASRQSLRSKQIGLARSADDAKVIMETDDGEVAGITDPEAVKEQVYGGADKNLFAIIEFSKNMLSYLAGNLDAIGGLAPSSGTLGQDQILTDSASGGVKDMQQSMIGFQTDVIGDIAFWEWQDPFANEPFTKQLSGTQYSIPQVWTPESRQGEFFQYNYRVNPYSYVQRSPTEQASFIIDIVERLVLPSIPYMQQEGPVDWEFLFKLVARYSHAPELNQIIRFPGGNSIPGQMPATPEQPKMPARTTRTYERVNRQAPQSGQSKLLELLMNGNGNGHSEA
jgi:hypothetical protein